MRLGGVLYVWRVSGMVSATSRRGEDVKDWKVCHGTFFIYSSFFQKFFSIFFFSFFLLDSFASFESSWLCSSNPSEKMLCPAVKLRCIPLNVCHYVEIYRNEEGQRKTRQKKKELKGSWEALGSGSGKGTSKQDANLQQPCRQCW